jgi:hypothetical protein
VTVFEKALILQCGRSEECFVPKVTDRKTAGAAARLETLQSRLDAAVRDLHEIRAQIDELEARDPFATLRSTVRRRLPDIPFAPSGDEGGS